jgi:hypothetical protein
MIESELLKEKHRVQTRLAEESSSVHDYLLRTHCAAEAVAAAYGFRLHYVKLPNKRLGPTAPQRAAGQP